VVPRNKDLITDVPLGTVYHQVASGGGGYGDPKLRDRALLAQEVRNGIISPQAAEREYGLLAPSPERP
jgi:N-methylhydantoinase B